MEDSKAPTGALGLRLLMRRLTWLVPVAALCVALVLMVVVQWRLRAGALVPDEAAFLMLALTVAGLVFAGGVGWGLLRLKHDSDAVLAGIERDRRALDQQLERRQLVVDVVARMQQARSQQQLSDIVLSALSQPLHIHQGLCCLWDEAAQQVVAVGRYGGQGQDALAVMAAQPQLGNLIEACGHSREPMLLDGSGVLRLGSGLGESQAASVLIFPMCHGGRLFAVLELASLHRLDDSAVQLLRDLEPAFSMSLDILQRSDRTERLLIEARAAEESSALILASVGEGIWGLDERGRISFVNQAGLSRLGYRLEEVVGRRMHDLVHHHRADGSVFPPDQCPVALTLKDGEMRNIAGDVMWHKDGSPVSVEYVVTAVHRGEEIAGAVLVFRDPEQMKSAGMGASNPAGGAA